MAKTKKRNDLYRLPGGREKMLAHDVRKLTTCTICGGIADERTSISKHAAYGYSKKTVATHSVGPDSHWHPRCCFENFGAKFVLNQLPNSELEKFCMSDADLPTIQKIIEDLSAAAE